MFRSICRRKSLVRQANSHCRAYTIAGHNLDEPIQSYISTSQDPYLNLSIEHLLLQQSAKSSSLLFIYINRPCVVIGRNQNPWTEVNLSLLEGSAAPGRIDLVRRRSGGGTVFHDGGNVNWTVICPSDAFTRDKHAEMVVRALRRCSIPNCRVNERHDIVLDQRNSHDHSEWTAGDDTHSTPWTGLGKALKASGSAYKLTRGRALHHGTALLNSQNLRTISAVLKSPSKSYMESKGVESVPSPVGNIGLDNDLFIDHVQKEFGQLYSQRHLKSCLVDHAWLSDDEVRKGYNELKSLDWTYRQTPRFTISTKADTKTTMPGLSMSVRSGIIEEIDLAEVDNVTLSHVQERLLGREVHSISNWSTLLSAEGTDRLGVRNLGKWLQTMLPPPAQQE